MENLFEIQLKCLCKAGHGRLLEETTKAKSYLDQLQLEEQQEIQQQLQNQQPLPLPTQSYSFNFHNFIKQLSKILMVAFVALAQYPLAMYWIYHIDDISLVTAVLSIMLTNLLGVVKIATFLWSKTEFIMTIKIFNEMFQNLQNHPRAAYILTKANKRSRGLVKVYVGSALCTSLFFLIEPLVKLFWAKVVKGENDVVLETPICTRFPFDTTSPFNYFVSFCYCSLAALLVALYLAAVDGLFMTFTVNLSAHFKVLQNFIKSHPFQYETSNDIVREELRLHRDISNLVRYHNLLLRLSTDVCRIYKPIIFGQLVITSLDLCLIIYQFFIMDQTTNVMNILMYGTFMLAVILQLFMYCYGGEIVSNESRMCSTAIQLSNWYALPPSKRLMILMMLIRSQRPVTIGAFVYDANLATFMTILKAAVSYITLIRSIE